MYGGAERLLGNMVKIHATSMDVEIIYMKGEPKLLSEFPENVKVTLIPMDKNVFGKIRNKILTEKPDIVHSHLGHADLITLWATRGINVKKFCTMHNIWFKWDWRDKVIFFLYKVLFKTVSSDCKVISISSAVKDHVDNRLGVKSENSFKIYNGIPNIDRSQYSSDALREELGIGKEKFVALFVGRLRLQKSPHDLIAAINLIKGEIPDLKLILVGDGPLKYELQQEIEANGLEDIVQLVGTVSDPEKYFELSDIFVLPSVFEGLGLVILEAFRSCLPVVSTNIEGPKELVENGRNGILVDPKKPQQLADAILKLYRNPELRRTLGLNGNKSFQDTFSIDHYASEIKELYLKS